MGQGLDSVEKHTREVTYRASVTNRHIASLPGPTTDVWNGSKYTVSSGGLAEFPSSGVWVYIPIFLQFPGNGD